MALVLDTNMILFADRMHISSSRMVEDYGLKTVDEIIEAEAERGNQHAIRHSKEYYHSPEKLIKYFRLADVENKFVLLNRMDDRTREKVLPMLESEDLVMGLYFFTQDKLLEMLKDVDIEEIVAVIQEAFPLEQIILMFTEEDLSQFFLHDKLEKYDVMEQLKALPPEVMQRFIESITGMPSEKTNPQDLLKSLDQLPDDAFKKFMSAIDPATQRQLTFQLTKVNPEYLQLFENETYLNMLNTLMKPEMIKPMIMLNKESLVTMIEELPSDLMSIVAAQVDTLDFAKLLQKGHMDLIENAWMI